MTEASTGTPTDFLNRVATAPISWGICEVPGWGHQLSPERVLGEMRGLGFTATELGSAGWLPEDRSELSAILAANELTLLASFVPLVLHKPAEADQALAEAREHANLLQSMGARYFNTAPVTSADWEPRQPLSDEQWQHLYHMLGAVEDICVERGLIQVIHEHVGCVIETAEEVDQVLANTAVRFVLDTGHLAVGGYDPVAFVTHHADRVGLVHLKDTKLDVAKQLTTGELTLMEAVQNDLFPALGDGDLDIATVVTVLEESRFPGWYVIEQDCAITGLEPEPGDGPVGEVRKSLAYLQSVAEGLQTGG